MKIYLTRFQLTLLIILLLSACSSSPTKNLAVTSDDKTLTSLYDYQLINSVTKKTQSIKSIVSSMLDQKVIFLGEFHTHQASHKFQLDLFKALYARNPNLILSMEQFSRDSQPILDGYLAGKYGEATLIAEGNAWEDYKGSYRAIVEFAKNKGLPIVAANAPAMFVRCVGKRGADFLQTLPEDKSQWSATALDLDNEKYKEKFLQFLKESGRSHGQTKDEANKRQMKTYAAQLLRDTTMAESIASALERSPQSQVVHLNGSFHSDNHLGTVAVLESMLPKLVTTVISPVMISPDQPLNDNEYAQGEYVYLVKPLPERYLDEQKEITAITKLIKLRKSKKCEL